MTKGFHFAPNPNLPFVQYDVKNETTVTFINILGYSLESSLEISIPSAPGQHAEFPLSHWTNAAAYLGCVGLKCWN